MLCIPIESDQIRGTFSDINILHARGRSDPAPRNKQENADTYIFDQVDISLAAWNNHFFDSYKSSGIT